MIKELAKTTLLSVYKYSGAIAAQERIAYWSGKSFLAVLLLHRVTDDIPPDGLTVTTAWFRGMCALLKERFHVVSLAEGMRILASGKRLPRRVVAITFDDCYRDNLFAARVLAEYELPACFFIPTAFPGTDHIFPWDVGLRPMANLSWREIREMADMGHEIGAHTVSHADMAQISIEQARQELVDSKSALESQLERPVRWFAYPYGSRTSFPRERLPLVFEAGYHGCFSGFGGFAYPGVERQIVPRLAVPCFRSLLDLELYLTDCLSWVYALKRKAGVI